MTHLQYLFAGFTVFWAALLVYLLVLQARLRGLQREIERLEERLADEEPGGRAATPSDAPGTEAAARRAEHTATGA
jgi:CcmD family protein